MKLPQIHFYCILSHNFSKNFKFRRIIFLGKRQFHSEISKRRGGDRKFLKMVELLGPQNRKIVELLGVKCSQKPYFRGQNASKISNDWGQKSKIPYSVHKGKNRPPWRPFLNDLRWESEKTFRITRNRFFAFSKYILSKKIFKKASSAPNCLLPNSNHGGAKSAILPTFGGQAPPCPPPNWSSLPPPQGANLNWKILLPPLPETGLKDHIVDTIFHLLTCIANSYVIFFL